MATRAASVASRWLAPGIWVMYPFFGRIRRQGKYCWTR